MGTGFRIHPCGLPTKSTTRLGGASRTLSSANNSHRRAVGHKSTPYKRATGTFLPRYAIGTGFRIHPCESHQHKRHHICGAFCVGGSGWIRTTEVSDNRFTVCPLWPLGNAPMLFHNAMYYTKRSFICQPLFEKYFGFFSKFPKLLFCTFFMLKKVDNFSRLCYNIDMKKKGEVSCQEFYLPPTFTIAI